MPSDSVRGGLRRWWPAILLAFGVLGAEFLILDFVVLNQPNENDAGQHAVYDHQECGESQPLALSINSAQRVACIFLFKNLRFIDRYHDTLNAISTLAVAIFTATLWSTTRKLWEASKKQIGLLESDQTQRLAEIEASLKLATESAAAATKAADAAAGSLDLTRKTYIATQRPRLRVSNIWLMNTGKSRLEFRERMGIGGLFECENVGGTVAHIKKADAMILCRAGGLPAQYPLGSRQHPVARRNFTNVTDGADVQPGDVETMSVSGAGYLNLTLEEADDLTNGGGKFDLYVLGWIDFADDLGFMRRCKFCRRYDFESGRFVPVRDTDYENEA